MARKVTIRRGLYEELPTLDIGELGYAIDTEGLYIGSENGNVLFAKKSELDFLQEEINNIQQSSVFTRLGVSENGLLTIDGLEQQLTGGGSSDMTLVVKDYFEGSTNITKTYTDNMVGFAISNDAASGGSQLTFTINGLTIPVKAQETYEANFLPYKSVTITTTVPYRATVSMPYGTTVDSIAPNNVTGLSTSNITTNGVTLSWTASSSNDTAGYDIYNGSTLVTSVVGTTYNVTNLTPSTSYTFTVKAKDGSGNISSGVSVTISTIADIVAPNNVTNLTTSNVSSTALSLSWTASTSTDTIGYDIYNASTLLGTVTGTTYNVTGLTANTNYTFTVKAKDGSNNVASGASVSVTTSSVVDATAPNNVTNLTTSNLSTTSVTLNWTASSSSDTVGYDIYNGSTLVTSTTNTSYTVTGLSEKTQYTFSVKAKDAANNVASGTSVTITTVDGTAPNNVTNLTTSNVTQTGLTLTWTASTSSDIASYDVYQGSTLLTNVTGTTYNVTGLTMNTQYTFTVKSKDATGNVSTGASVTVTTASDTTAPNDVTSITTSNITKTSAQLNWTPSSSSDTASYEIYDGSTLIGSVAHPNSLYVVTGLTLGTTYNNFVIKAKDNSNNVSNGVSVPSFTTVAASGYYIALDGVDDKVVIPNPAGTRIMTMKLARRNADTGVLFDFRPNNTIYAGNSSTGYSTFEVNGVSKAMSNANVSTDLPNNTVVDLKVTLTADALAGNITIGKHNSAVDYLNMDLYDVKLYDVNNTLLSSFTFSGSGTTLTGTNGNGTITGGTWTAY